MANLTGEYDVATEVGVGLVNAVLAATHENDDDAFPTLPHSIQVQVVDAYRGAGDPIPEPQRTGVAANAEIQLSTPTLSLPLDGRPGLILARSRGPLGASAGAVRPGAHPSCWPQISVRLGLRAWLRDVSGDLPPFLHGDLHLTTGIVRTDVSGLGTFLGLDHASGPAVAFEPAAGTTLSGEQRALVERVVGNFIRADSEPVTFKVDLPPEVRRFDYELRPQSQRPSAMLAFDLTDRPPGPRGPPSVSTSLLPGGADFAVAVGRDYLLGLFRSQLLQGLPSAYTASGTGFSANIQPDWSAATFDLQTGRMVFSVSGSGSVTYGFWPVTFTHQWSFFVRQAVTLGVVGGVLTPELAGDPEVELYDVPVFEGAIRERAREYIRTQLQLALDARPAALRTALDIGHPLDKMLRALHPGSPGVALTGAEIRPDGVVVAGTVALAPTRAIEVRRVAAGGFSDALDSWIPGGTIDRFVWDTVAEPHRFVSEKREMVTDFRCLAVEGTRVTRGGGVAAVRAQVCPDLIATLPILAEPPPPEGPSRRPLLALLGATSDGGTHVLGHYDPWASGNAPAAGPTNLLVHFAEGSWRAAAATIDAALAAGAGAGRDAAVVVVGVVGSRALADAADAELEHATLLLTDDPSGGWKATFGVAAPATVLVGPAGRVAWKDEGPLDPATLEKALEQHLEGGGAVSWQVLRSAAATGDGAPDALLQFGDGRALPLRRLRGGSVALSFWSASSEPSIEQLRQLSKALEAEEEGRPYVIGIGDGESEQQVRALAGREQFPFPLVPDPERLISRRFGISCWPATVQIGSDGRFVAVDLGLVPGLSPCDRRVSL
jgi:peroxiredoxin